jgi:uncharacterized membrane protein (DUF106 family)
MIIYAGVVCSVVLLVLLMLAELRRAAGRSNRLLNPAIVAFGFATAILVTGRLVLILVSR